MHMLVHAVLWVLGSLFASEPAKASIGVTRHQGLPDIDASLADWRGINGHDWSVQIDPGTGFASLIYGGRARSGADLRDEAQAIEAARGFIESTKLMHGHDARTLPAGDAVFLPLGQIGSSDKWNVKYRQSVDGIRVVGGYLNVLMNANGVLLSLQSTGLPGISDLLTVPAIAPRSATVSAYADFKVRHRMGPTKASQPELVIDQVTRGGRRSGQLAWEVKLQRSGSNESPEGRTYWVDAHSGEILRSVRNVHEVSSSAVARGLQGGSEIPEVPSGKTEKTSGGPGWGTVSTLATPGLAPDTAANPATTQIMPHARIYDLSGQLLGTTNDAGSFFISGIADPTLCFFTYEGPYCDVRNEAGSDYSLAAFVWSGSNTILLNPGASATVTSQANAFVCVNKLRSWVKNTGGTTMADFTVIAKTNFADSCNAVFDGDDIQFFVAAGGCPNTAYSTVISHEQGHWMNDKYDTANGDDGMNEGNADVWAMYLWDTPVVGKDFFGAGQDLRTGWNTVPYCGDGNPSCHGSDEHENGKPWMGAAWKIRNRLGATYGNAAGALIANNLFFAWMQSFTQSTIDSIIETQWLLLDDNDGILNNGTPHLCDIDGGFRDQQFPGFHSQPVLHYSFDNPSDRGHDDSGHDHEGVVGAATFLPGTCGPSSMDVLPDNNQQELYTVDEDDLDIILAMTGMAWIMPKGQQSTDNNPSCPEGTIFCKGGNYWFQVGRDNNQLEFQNEGSGNDIAVVPVTLPLNQWSHVAFVRESDGRTVRFFVNGDFIGERTLVNGAWFNPDIVMFGNYGFGSAPGACEFNGQIEEIKIWNYALEDC
jgi:hypothetical protein